MKVLNHILSLLLVVVLLMAIAVRRDKAVLGFELKSGDMQGAQKTETTIEAKVLKKLNLRQGEVMEISPYIWKVKDGRVIYGSIPYGKDIIGYSGPTPVYIVEKDGRIEQVVAGTNSESSEFFGTLYDQHFFDKWRGMTLDETATAQVDAVSGATYSSTAVLKTVRTTASKVAKLDLTEEAQTSPFTMKNVMGMMSLLIGLFVAFFRKGKFWRILQLLLNVVILGFWCGCFLSMSLFVGWLSHGVHPLEAIVVFVMLILAVIIPFISKKKNYYCLYVCPFGSAQELMGLFGFPKWKIPPRVMSFLRYTRRAILWVLLGLMWMGVAFKLMDYEAFSAFLFDKAKTEVLVLAGIFLLLSLFVNRPYCRFVCPTGQLLSWSQGFNVKIRRGRKS